MQVIAINTESREIFMKAAHMMILEGIQKVAGKRPRPHGIQGLRRAWHPARLVIIGRAGRIVHVYQGYDERRLKEIVADINRAIAPS